MKTFIKGLNKFFTVLEIMIGIGVIIGILVGAIGYGPNPVTYYLFFLGFSLLSFIYFIMAITPFYKRYVSTSPVMNEKFSLFVRRLMYLAMMLYTPALIFFGWADTEDWMIAFFIAALVISAIAVTMVFFKRERKEVLGDVGLRMICLFAMHFISTTMWVLRY